MMRSPAALSRSRLTSSLFTGAILLAVASTPSLAFTSPRRQAPHRSVDSLFTPAGTACLSQRGQEVVRRAPSAGAARQLSMVAGGSGGLTLYGSQGSRSPLVNWGACELGIELTMGDLASNPHPFGQIPCLTDGGGDVIVFESGAILSYLLTKAGDGKAPDRNGAILSWIAWANASLDPICFLETPEGKVYDTGLKKPNRRIDTLDSILSKQEFLVEDGFSLADVAVASYLLYVLQFFPGIDLSRWPNIVRYMKDCAERPCYREAFGSGVQQYLIEALGAMGGAGDEKKKLFGMF